jgi:N-acyl-D-amino-acid deacylase
MATIDYIIRNARIIDGTGAPATRGDVAISSDTVVAVGDRLPHSAAQEIDADGLTLAPGFWDPHTHFEYDVILDQRQEGFIAQGVTTLITGNCGSSMFPTKRVKGSLGTGKLLEEYNWNGMREYADVVSRRGTSINSSPLIANGPLRYDVIGNEDRRATPEELQQMKDVLERGMREGALGMSTGLDYIPSLFADTDELVELTEVVAKYGGVYASHTRDCSPIYAYSYHAEEVLAPAEDRAAHLHGVLELIEIGRRTRARVLLSHLHTSGIIGTEMAAVRQARREGIDVVVDAITYNVSTSIRSDVLLLSEKELAPDLVDLPLQEVKALFRKPEFRHELSLRPQARRYLSPERAGTWELSRTGARGWDGRTVGDVAAEKGISSVDMMFDLMLDEHNPVCLVPPASLVRPVPYEMLADPLVIPESDALMTDPADPYGKYSARAHVAMVRYWEMAREQGLPEEEIIRKMTSLPARRFDIWDRGTIGVGQKADIVVFSPDDFRGVADTHNPFAPAEGMHWVFVNGVPVMEQRGRTDNLPGKIILREPVEVREPAYAR